MKKFVSWIKDEESGQGMVEYGLIVALISIAAIAVIVLIGPKLTGIFTKVSDGLDGHVTP